MKCTTCNKNYSPDCDYKQGRCPHHKPMINIQPKDTSKGHFWVSLAKSFLRIVACVCLMLAGYEAQAGGALLVTTQMALMGAWLKISGGLLCLAEALGIVEEIV